MVQKKRRAADNVFVPRRLVPPLERSRPGHEYTSRQQRVIAVHLRKNTVLVDYLKHPRSKVKRRHKRTCSGHRNPSPKHAHSSPEHGHPSSAHGWTDKQTPLIEPACDIPSPPTIGRLESDSPPPSDMEMMEKMDKIFSEIRFATVVAHRWYVIEESEVFKKKVQPAFDCVIKAVDAAVKSAKRFDKELHALLTELRNILQQPVDEGIVD